MHSDLKKKNRFGRMTKARTITMSVLLSCTTALVYGQEDSSAAKSATTASTDTAAKPKTLKDIMKKLQISGTIRMRYTVSFEKNIGIDGTQHSSNTPPFTSNAFTIPQARVVLTGDITEKMNVYMRVNFGDFAFSPQSRVLEYAYGTYKFNPYLNVRMGLFRPWFGREDDITTDFLKSFDYSNQYNAFGVAGWVSYQMGVSLFGGVKISDIPVRYYTGVFNGNSRIDFSDNDNGKQFSARLESDLTKQLRVGINGGLGKVLGNHISAWGADINYDKDLSPRWNLEIESEYKQGNNQSLFFARAIPGKTIKDYKMRGVYVLPSIQYKIKKKEGLGLEASFKYECLDPDFKQNGNVWQQYVPMLGVDFVAQFAIRLQVGVVLDRYDSNVENSTTYNSGRFMTQLQLRF